MPRKIKTKAAKVKAAATRQEATEMIAKIGSLARMKTRLEADMNDRLAKTKQAYEDKAAPLSAEIAELTQSVTMWAEAHREDLTNGNKTKTVKLASGRINWRALPPKCNLRGIEAIIEELKARDLTVYIRTKEEIDKEAMLRNPEAVAMIKGVSIASEGEEVIITPHQIDIEADASAGVC